MTDTAALTQWAIRKIETEYPEDIELLIGIDNHSYKGDGHGKCFDYYIPATQRGNELGQTFIIDGVGHDLYPRSWKRIENMANLDDWFVHGLDRGNILYARNEQARARFEAMRVILHHNLQNKEFTYLKALKLLDESMELFRTMSFEENLGNVRMAAGYIEWNLARGIAFINGTYFHNAYEDEKSEEMKTFAKLPEQHLENRRAVYMAMTIEELRQIAHNLIASMRAFLKENEPSRPAVTGGLSPEYLAGWYEEGSLILRRLYGFCEDNMPQLAFAEGVSLQREIGAIRASLEGIQLDILSAYDPDNLLAFAANARQVEADIVKFIEDKGGTIRRYATLEEFLQNS